MTSPTSMLICARDRLIAVKRTDDLPAIGASTPDWDQVWKFAWKIDYRDFVRTHQAGDDLIFYASHQAKGNRAGALLSQRLSLDRFPLAVPELERHISSIKDRWSQSQHSGSEVLMSSQTTGSEFSEVEAEVSKYHTYIANLNKEIHQHDIKGLSAPCVIHFISN
jgi:hypothetical protein